MQFVQVRDRNELYLSSLISVAGTVVAKLARRAAAATPLATVGLSASTKTGRGITSSAAQDFRLNPNRYLQAEWLPWLQQHRPPPSCLLLVWLGSKFLTVCLQSAVQVGRRLQSLRVHPLPPPLPRPLRRTDTRRQRTLAVHVSPTLFKNREELKQQHEGTICGLS